MRFMLDNSIMVEGKVCSGGIEMLEDFNSPISATVYTKCVESGMEFVGFCDPCEYANCDFLLCRDIFGKITQMAAKNRLIFAEAAYGTVSRYGVIQAVSSVDRIGVLCKSVDTAAKVMSVISGYDEHDETMFKTKEYFYATEAQSVKVATVNDVDMKYFSLLFTVYYCLASAEIANNMSRFDGVKYGHRANNATTLEDLYVRSRSEGFPREMKLASVIGNMVLSKENFEKWYYKAMQIRRLTVAHYTKILTEFDVMVLPIEMESMALASLCGFASLVTEYTGEPCLLVCKRGNENAMLTLGGAR